MPETWPTEKFCMAQQIRDLDNARDAAVAEARRLRVERDRYRNALREVSARSADLVRMSYGCAVDSDGDWVRAHAAKTAAVVSAALTSRAKEADRG